MTESRPPDVLIITENGQGRAWHKTSQTPKERFAAIQAKRRANAYKRPRLKKPITW
jgi:hypothetical protein